MYYKSIEFMEDEGFIFAGIQEGDYTYSNGWKMTVTQAAKDCDCGKGMYCPYVIQERA